MLIRNIWAVGRNYGAHAKELGNDVPQSPLIFLKAGSTASYEAPILVIPRGVGELHHEVELALEFGADLSVRRAGLALDLTDRTAQNVLKARGEPWTLAKSFKGACPLAGFFEVENLDELFSLEIALWVNGHERQRGRVAEMIFPLPRLVEYLREHFPVCEGDLLLTGTPSGVGPLRPGDEVRARIEGRIEHSWRLRSES